jgi:hypothetical protein
MGQGKQLFNQVMLLRQRYQQVNSFCFCKHVNCGRNMLTLQAAKMNSFTGQSLVQQGLLLFAGLTIMSVIPVNIITYNAALKVVVIEFTIPIVLSDIGFSKSTANPILSIFEKLAPPGIINTG